MVRKQEDGRWEDHKEKGEPVFRYVLAKTQKELMANSAVTWISIRTRSSPRIDI